MTANLPRLDPSSAPGAFQVEDCDVPVDMTLGEWRRHRAAQRRAEQPAASGGAMRRGLRRLFAR